MVKEKQKYIITKDSTRDYILYLIEEHKLKSDDIPDYIKKLIKDENLKK